MAGALAAVDDARVEAQLRLPRPTIVITASVNLLTSALEESIGLAQTRKDLGMFGSTLFTDCSPRSKSLSWPRALTPGWPNEPGVRATGLISNTETELLSTNQLATDRSFHIRSRTAR